MAMMRPAYTHDCDRCTYLATVVSFGRTIDLYRSCSTIEGGYIARFSSEPSDYATVIEGHGPFTFTLEGERMVRTDYLTCVAVEKIAQGDT